MARHSVERSVLASRTVGYLALIGAVVGYGGLWPVTGRAIEVFPPFWFASLRMWVGIIILVGVLYFTGRLRMPSRRDVRLIISIGFLMMALYTALMHVALEYVAAGRAALLGYTTPLWVLPAAYLLFGQIPTRRKVAGIFIAMVGLVVLFNPTAFDWSNTDVVLGNTLLLFCAVLWSISIIHIRACKPTLTPLQLAPFQLTIAATFMLVLALLFDPPMHWAWTNEEFLLFGYGATFGTALAMISVTTCMRYLPTTISTVGLLGAPVCALVLSVIFLDEKLTTDLLIGVVLILGGMVLVSVPDTRDKVDAL